jgi:hypothetical protein
MPREVRVPQFLDRDADKDKQEGDADDPDPNEDADNPRQSPKVRDRTVKYAVVHQQKTRFGPAEIPGIEYLRNHQPLSHHHYILWGNLVCMKTHAGGEHCKDKADNKQVPTLFSERPPLALLLFATEDSC